MFDSQTKKFSTDDSMQALIEHASSVLKEHLRDYQLSATLFAISRSSKNAKPLLIEIPTGGGKSWICVSIAYVMSLIFSRAGYENRRTLIICPTDTLVEQNAEKLRRAGGDVAIFCASLKLKQTEGEIIVGTPVSIANAIELFQTLNIGCVIVDEAHVHAETSKTVVAKLKEQNPRLREFGMTATPFRTAEKYIYRVNSYNGSPPNTEKLAVDPYYDELVYRVSGEHLVQHGYLVPMLIHPIGQHYDTDSLKMGSGGRFTTESEREVFVTKTVNEIIVGDVLASTEDRKNVMIFCQNIEHAEVVYHVFLEKLKETPLENSAILYHSKMDKDQSRQNLMDFNERKYKYLISVRGLTTGYDNERVDGIVTLSTTESPGLYVQIMGRGMRPILSDKRIKKTHCRLYDYGENLQRHFPEGDLFTPFIKPVGRSSKSKGHLLTFHCPFCDHYNQAIASAWHEPMIDAGYLINRHGYFTTPDHDVLTCDIAGAPIAAHIKSACQGFSETAEGLTVPCHHIWKGQICHECGALNDNAAESCQYCKSDFTERRQKEREGKPRIFQMKMPKAFSSGLHQLMMAKVEKVDLFFDTRKDRDGKEYRQGTLTLTVASPSGMTLINGKLTFQKAINEKIKLTFNEHFDYIKASLSRKERIMKALWGESLSMKDAATRPSKRNITHVDYYWDKSAKGYKYVELVQLRSVLNKARFVDEYDGASSSASELSTEIAEDAESILHDEVVSPVLMDVETPILVKKEPNDGMVCDRTQEAPLLAVKQKINSRGLRLSKLKYEKGRVQCYKVPCLESLQYALPFMENEEKVSYVDTKGADILREQLSFFYPSVKELHDAHVDAHVDAHCFTAFESRTSEMPCEMQHLLSLENLEPIHDAVIVNNDCSPVASRIYPHIESANSEKGVEPHRDMLSTIMKRVTSMFSWR